MLEIRIFDKCLLQFTPGDLVESVRNYNFLMRAEDTEA